METTPITIESIDAYTELLTDPAKHGLTFTPIKEFFQKSETVTAKHTLAEHYIAHVGNNRLPKLILYIVMDKLFGSMVDKDAKGDLGYRLAVKEPATTDQTILSPQNSQL